MTAKLGILGLLLGGLIIFVLQNQDPVSLVLLNVAIPLQLPVSIWMLIFVGSGVVTSFFLQLLQLGFLGKPTTKIPRKSKPSPRPSETPQQRTKIWERSKKEPEPEKYTVATGESDWEKPSRDDWNIEEPPQKNPEREEFYRSLEEEQEKIPERAEFQRSLREEEEKEQEQPQKSTSRSSSVYSYGYEKPKDTAVGKIEKIYDVPYRVIIPPYKNIEPQQMEDEDDEEWIE